MLVNANDMWSMICWLSPGSIRYLFNRDCHPFVTIQSYTLKAVDFWADGTGYYHCIKLLKMKMKIGDLHLILYISSMFTLNSSSIKRYRAIKKNVKFLTMNEVALYINEFKVSKLLNGFSLSDPLYFNT